MTSEQNKAMDDLIAQDADLIDKLRDTDSYYRIQEKHWCIDHEELERQHLAAAALIETQAAELAKFKALAETLARALGQIVSGTYPRPLGKPWRMDASSSKHDRCIHDAWMYEACEACIDAFASEALREYKEARDAS